jgi:hypothetical protein
MTIEIKNLAKVIEEKKQTLDYKNYPTLNGVSRKINQAHVKEIMESMAMYGAEATTLIILETEAFGGVKLRFNADGNHRGSSASMLDLPLDIKVVKLTDDTQENVKHFISCLNNKLKRWTNPMYLEIYVAGNIREYVKFNQLMEETKLTITDLLFIYTGSGNTKNFQLGTLTFMNEKESDKKLEQVKRMLTYLPKHSFTRRGIWGVMKKTENYKKLATEIIKFAKDKQNEFSADEKTFKGQLLDIYNNTFTE